MNSPEISTMYLGYSSQNLECQIPVKAEPKTPLCREPNKQIERKLQQQKCNPSPASHQPTPTKPKLLLLFSVVVGFIAYFPCVFCP